MKTRSLIGIVVIMLFVIFTISRMISDYKIRYHSEIDKYLTTYGINQFMSCFYKVWGENRTRYAWDNAFNDMAQIHDVKLECDAGRVCKASSSLSSKLSYWGFRFFLAEFFKKLELAELQKRFLYWHFVSSRNYGRTVVDVGYSIVGWNSFLWKKVTDDYPVYTFGLVGCTAVIALSSSNEIFFSHYDGVANEIQFKSLKHFIGHYKVTEIVLIGAVSSKFYEKLVALKLVDSGIVQMFEKPEYYSVYSVKVFVKNAKLIIEIKKNNNLLTNYIDTIRGGNDNNGDFIQIFPNE